MASSFSTDLKLELMVTGENSGTWGDKTNTNLNLLQQAIAGYQSIALTSTNTTLVMTDATISNARNAVIEFTGTLAANATVFVASGIEKTYTIKNSTTGAYTLALNQVGGASVIWGTTEKNIKGVYLNGTNANTIDLSTLGGAISTSASIGDFVIGPNELDTSSVTSVKIASFAVTSAKLDTSSVTSVKVASFAITSAALDTASVTSVKIASAAVGTTQLIATGVTAATYTAATITVAADGRITSASSGSGGAGGFVPTLVAIGPASGTYTATPTAGRLAVYMSAGGARSGGGDPANGSGGQGGSGGYGFYNKPITQPFAQPYSVGGASGATPFTNVGTVNTGNAGQSAAPGTGGSPGNPGTAPGAALDLTSPSVKRILITPSSGLGGIGNPGEPAGIAGSPGILIVYENTVT
jgi:hypothetical protein